MQAEMAVAVATAGAMQEERAMLTVVSPEIVGAARTSLLKVQVL
jgi:hypothetical protein